MTTKDFVAIAGIIRGMRSTLDLHRIPAWNVTTIIARKIAEIYEDDDVQFDRETFLELCGLDSSNEGD